LDPFVLEPQTRVKCAGEWTFSIHPDLEGFQALNPGKGMKVISKILSVDPQGGLFDSRKNIGRPSQMDQMSKMVFLGPSWKAYIDLHHIGFQLRANQKINSEIHFLQNENPSFLLLGEGKREKKKEL